jgi:hypothetical protein
VTPSSLNDGVTIAGGARVHFNTVYVSNGTIVALDSTEPLVLPLIVLIHDVPKTDGGVPKPPRPTPLTLRIHQPIVTFDSTGENGTIAGVLTAQEAFAQATLLTDALFAPDCTQSAAVVDQVSQSQDIVADGTNQAGVPCNAISIGLGFTAKRVANPTTVGVDPPPAVDACDAGAD